MGYPLLEIEILTRYLDEPLEESGTIRNLRFDPL